MFILNLLFVFGCREESSSDFSLRQVNIEDNLFKFETLGLSKISSEINYISLQNDFIINNIRYFDNNSEFILAGDNKVCLLFDNAGVLKIRIGKEGRGPSEYVGIVNAGLGFSNNVFIQDINGFLEYKTDGSFVKRFTLKKCEEDKSFYMFSWVPLNDSLFFGQIPLSTGKEDSKAFIFDKNGRTREEFKNFIFLNREKSIFSTDDYMTSFYWYNNQLHIKEKMNDTLFCLKNSLELSPVLSFNKGKYASPKELRETVDPDKYVFYDYVFVENVFETSDFFLIGCYYGKYFPAKRITPLEVMGKQFWTNYEKVLGLYSKESKSLLFSRPTSTDNTLYYTGFYNDIDAGPRFFPMKQVNDSTMVMWIDAKKFKDHVESNDFKESAPKYPEEKKKLEYIANRLTEFDNPVLMFVTFKHKK